jgi:hypothetical protein
MKRTRLITFEDGQQVILTDDSKYAKTTITIDDVEIKREKVLDKSEFDIIDTEINSEEN